MRLYRQLKKLCVCVCVVVYSSYFVRPCIPRFILIHLNCMISPSMKNEVRSLIVFFCIFKLNVRTETSKGATVMCAHITLHFLLAHLLQVHCFLSQRTSISRMLRLHHCPLALVPVTKIFCSMSTVLNAAESRERVTILVFTFIAHCLWVWKIGYGISFQILLYIYIYIYYTAAVSGIVTCCNSVVLFCSILSSLSIFSTKVSEVTIFFFWMDYFFRFWGKVNRS